MAFEIEHDWQTNIATPRARIGVRAKNHLLIFLCALWICLGLIGHDPWKPQESHTISIVKSMLNNGSLVSPVAVGERAIDNPPLYYLSAALFAKILSPVLAMHDAARVVTGIWMALTLMMVGMIGRELWGVGIGRQTTFIFISSLGLIVTAHQLTPEVSALTGSAMGFYALALAKRRPYRASVLLGTSLGISFLSTGLLPLFTTLACALSLPIAFRAWRSRNYATVLTLSLAFAMPWFLIWPILCWHNTPDLFIDWWQSSITSFTHFHYLRFLKTMSWFTWPALPIALWGLWRYRTALLFKPKFQLAITYFVCSFALLGLNESATEIYALPLLLPLTAIAGGSVDTLKRGAAGLLNWFGLVLFSIIGFAIWLGWVAMITGWPVKLSKRMHLLSGITEASINWWMLALAIIFSLIWISTISTKRSNRAAVTDWAVGMTMAWCLLMTLWLPFINHARSYAPIMSELKQALPAHFGCINSKFVDQPQQALLEYYTDIRAVPLETEPRLECDLYLIQDSRDRDRVEPGQDWHLIWQGKRAAERRESFRLYQINQ